MTLEKKSPCKVNLILNILGKRPDSFHELETVMHPVQVHDTLAFERVGATIQLSCNDPLLPTNSKNLVYRAAALFLKTASVTEGVKIHLQKRIPIAAGLGGGSGNAAVTLLAMNELFGGPLSMAQLIDLAASLGSDIPFFLQDRPALATGRGEKVTSLDFFPAFRDASILLAHPGFGISTPWAYEQLARFSKALNGAPGRAEKLVALLREGNLTAASREFYNSLEAPALQKYPLLELFQQFFRENGASATLMSGSGSATFAIIESGRAGGVLEEFNRKFGDKIWTAIAPLG